jgi:hypothetical protein
MSEVMEERPTTERSCGKASGEQEQWKGKRRKPTKPRKRSANEALAPKKAAEGATALPMRRMMPKKVLQKAVSYFSRCAGKEEKVDVHPGERESTLYSHTTSIVAGKVVVDLEEVGNETEGDDGENPGKGEEGEEGTAGLHRGRGG